MKQPESNRIEYKSTLTDKFEREVVAFLNYPEGGLIYIGVDDNGEAVGVADVDDLQLKIVDRIKNNIQPNTLGLFDVVIENQDKKHIVKIIIAGGPEKPYYIKKNGMSPTGCYFRLGSTTQPMDTAMIDGLYARRIHRHRLSDIPAPRRKLTFEQLRIYYEEKGKRLNENFAKSLDLLTPDGKYNYIAFLLSDDNNVSIKVAKYAGTDKYDLIENEEYGCCSILKATNRVLDKLRIENKTFAKITSTKRKEWQMVDAIALREAVINAIVHNDYGSEIPPVFEIYSDKITVTSYGGLVAGYKKEDLLHCISVPRNRELMRIFRDLDMVEQLGSGMSRILKFYDESIFNFTQNFMIVTFPFDAGFISPNGEINGDNGEINDDNGEINGDDGAINGDNGEINGEINTNLILLEFEKNPKAKLADLAIATGLSERTITRMIKQLKDRDKIRRVGSNKSGYWRVM